MSSSLDRIKAGLSAVLGSSRGQVVLKSAAMIEASPIEAELARVFLGEVLPDRDAFFSGVSVDDEMYIYLRANLPDKRCALAQYMYGGWEAVQVIENIVQAAGKTLGGLRSFLDFACGYGKSTRFLVQSLSPGKVWVSDIYRGAVDFQKASLGVNGFYSATNPDRIKFPQKYEVIYVGSLFSHLPAPRFKAFLSRLYGVLDDDGLIIFSTHGETVSPLKGDAAGEGFMFTPESESRSLDKQEYGSTVVNESWVRNLCNELGIAGVHYLERELWAQDVFVVSKNRATLPQRLEPNSYPRAQIEGMAVNAEGKLQISGWAMDRRHGAPLAQISVEIEPGVREFAELGLCRPDVAAYFNRPDWEHCGWRHPGVPVRGLGDEGGPSSGRIAKIVMQGRSGATTTLVVLVESGSSQENA
jgi:SAM-dependent methyltransferase